MAQQPSREASRDKHAITEELLEAVFYIRIITTTDQLKKKISGCESQGASRQVDLIGDKPSIVT
jgi:hypothetical protein